MKLLRQFITFSAVGAIGTIAHFIVLIITVQALSSEPVTGSIMGFITGAIINYILNYHVTFKSRKKHLESFLKFFAIATIGLGLNVAIMLIMTGWLHYLFSQIVATTIVLAWNFLCNRFWTFREVHFVKQS